MSRGRKAEKIMGLDTETCNAMVVNNKLDLSQSLVYDIGWIITDRKGRIYKKRSYVIWDIFCNMQDVMSSAYYASKIPQYWKDIKQKKRKLIRWENMYYTFLADCKKYNIKVFFAHNASFDVNALNNTMRYVTKSKFRYFFPAEADIWCTLKMARQVILPMKKYRTYCKSRGYMTNQATPRPRLTAEILYRFFTGDDNFTESHTGLEDVEIEIKILVECFKKHKKMDKVLFKGRR